METVVNFNSDNGAFFTEWNTLSKDIQNRLAEKYNKFHQQALDADARYNEVKNMGGIKDTESQGCCSGDSVVCRLGS